MTEPVRAQAIVDDIGGSFFKVTVTGLPPHAETRIYTISASCDTKAAMTGIDYFVRAMENAPGKPHED